MAGPMPPPTTSPTNIPDRYQVRRLLGKGGMGKVYLAADREAGGGPVAIKVLAVPRQMLQAAAARFRREAAAQRGVEDPHLLKILAQDLETDPPYLVMEYVDGGDVERRLKEEGPMPFSEVATLVDQVAGALDALHAKGVVHRDLKPSNIMLRRDGGAVLMDLGLAKVEGATVLTATGQLVGTPLYLPPEAIRDGGWGPPSDVYQLGAIAFECLVGKPLLKGSTMEEIISSLSFGDHREYPPGSAVPATAREAIRVAVALAPGDRFASAGEFARAFRGGGGRAGVPTTSLAPTAPGGGAGAGPAAVASGQRRGALVGLMAVGVAVGVFWRRPAPAPAGIRWRVTGDSLVASFEPGEARGVAIELGGRRHGEAEPDPGGGSRIVWRGLTPLEPVKAKLVWDGGESAVETVVGDHPAAERKARLGPGRTVMIRFRRSAEAGYGATPLARVSAGEELSFPAPPRDFPLAPVRWREDGVDFRRELGWEEVLATGVEGLPSAEDFYRLGEWVDHLRARSGVRRSGRARDDWRRVAEWIPTLLGEGLPVATRRRVWRDWQASAQVAAVRRIFGEDDAWPRLPRAGLGGRAAGSLAPGLDQRVVPMFTHPADGKGWRIGSPEAQVHFKVRNIVVHDAARWTWPEVPVAGAQPVDLALKVEKLRREHLGRVESEDGHFRVDFWCPRKREKFSGWIRIRLPADLLPPAGTPVTLRILPVRGYGMHSIYVERTQLWVEGAAP